MKTIMLAALAAGLTATAANAQDGFTYWSMWNQGEPQQKMLSAAIADFTAKTGIKVDVQWVGRDINKKIGPTLNSATTPFTLVDGPRRKIYSTLIATGAEASTDAIWASEIPGEQQTVEAAFLPGLRNIVTENGHTWMVPYTVLGSAWWYDAARMPELKGHEPKTWDEMIALFKAKKAAGDQVIAQDGDIGFYNLYYFTEIAVRHLGPGKVDAAIADKTGKALAGPEILATAKQIEELVKDGFFAKGYNSSKWPAQQQSWAAGNIDFIYNGSWLPGETASFLPAGAKPESFAMPSVGPNSIATNEVDAIGFSISKKGPDIADAEKFVAFVMQHDYLQTLATEAKVITPRMDVTVVPSMSALDAALNSGVPPHASYDGVNTYHAEYTTKVLTPLLNKLMFGQIDAKTFQDDLVAQTAQYWEIHG